MNLRILFLLIFSFSALSCLAYNENDESIRTECEHNKLFLANNSLTIDCNDLYHLYVDSMSTSSADHDYKVAGYNIYKLGNKETKFKDLTINAHMINQWDVVAVTELVPVMAAEALSNNALEVLMDYESSESELEGKQLDKFLRKKFSKKYKKPGYLKLLDKLRELDPEAGWSLIISPYMQTKSFELSGFYFKKSKVSIKNTPYCQKTVNYLKKEGAINFYKYINKVLEYETTEAVLPSGRKKYGCFPAIAEKDAKYMGRFPFLASFKIGKHAFTLLTIHARYRENPNKEKGKAEIVHILNTFHPEGEDIPLVKRSLITKLVKEKKGKKSGLTETEFAMPEVQEILENDDLTIELLLERQSYMAPAKELVRFFETYISTKTMNQIKGSSDKNVMLVGDLNLNLKETRATGRDFWDLIRNAYPGAEIYNDHPSSISEKDKLANDYDHFILNPKQNKNCFEGERAAMEIFNFLEEDYMNRIYPGAWDDLIGKYLSPTKLQKKKLISEYRDQVEKKYLYRGTTLNTIDYRPFSEFKGTFRDCRNNGKSVTTDAVSAFVDGYECSVFHSQSVPRKKWKVFKVLISDHLPVVLSCRP